MKRFLLLGVGIVLATLVGLAACTPKISETQSVIAATSQENTAVVVEQTEAVTPSEEVQSDATAISAATETPAIDVEALILEKLANNHGIERVYAAKHTREEWNATLDRMIGHGAKISEEEKQIIIDYLLSRK